MGLRCDCQAPSDLNQFHSKDSARNWTEKCKCEEIEDEKMFPRRELLQLSLAQKQIWYSSQIEGSNSLYNVPIILNLRGELNYVFLSQALNGIFIRHDVLRTTFVLHEGEPKAKLWPVGTTIRFVKHDLRGKNYSKEQVAELCNKESQAPFDLSKGLLVRATLICLDDENTIFMLTLHNIICDNESIDVLLLELAKIYAAFIFRKQPELPDLEVQYYDYVAWQQRYLTEDKMLSQLEYWLQKLNGVPSLLSLPTDHPRISHQSFSRQSKMFKIDETLTQALHQVSENNESTIFSTILTAWAIVLSRLSSQKEVVIGTFASNRTREEVKPLIGLFSNQIALRINLVDELGGDLTTSKLIQRVKECITTAQANQDLPFEQLLEKLNPARHLGNFPLFQAMFSWYDRQQTSFKLPELEIVPAVYHRTQIKFDLELTLQEYDDCIHGFLHYASNLFNAETIGRHCKYLINTMYAMVSDNCQTVSKIQFLPSEERNTLLKGWNDTNVSYRYVRCFHELFENQVALNGAAVALLFKDEQISYLELNARANRLAHCLIKMGVKPETRVAVCASRSPAMIVGFLGILKAGGAYVPLDPAYSSQRLKNILNDSTPIVLLEDETGRRALGNHNIPTVALDKTLPAEYKLTNPDALEIGLKPKSLAYVIYTSGSTGKPKGVMVEHQVIINLAFTLEEILEVKKDHRILQFASCGFDVSIIDIVIALTNGARLCLPTSKDRQTDTALFKYISTNGITHALLPPAIFHPDQDLNDLTSLQALVLLGESPPLWLLQAASRVTTVVNAYGPTETQLVTTWFCPKDYDKTHVLIGRPVANTHIYLLNAELQPVPLGAVGEIFIGGLGVARGYLNLPQITANRFIPDPFSEKPGARLYRSGDLARYMPDGQILFLGRNDHQVKIRGFRIEPGEIEFHLNSHPKIHESLVLPWVKGTETCLVAYVVAESIKTLAEDLRLYLKAILPDYMVPVAYVSLPAFPLTSNGKIDRQALPTPTEQAFSRQEFEPPVGKMEQQLAAIWCDLLSFESISRNDNFFALGGNSLMAAQLISRLHRIGLSTSIKEVFEASDLAALTAHLRPYHDIEAPPNFITSHVTALSPEMLPLINLSSEDIQSIIKQVPGGISNIQDIYGLVPVQDGMLFHHLMADQGDPYLITTHLRFTDHNALTKYANAVQQVIRRHDILRTIFFWEGLNEPAQVVLRDVPYVLTEINIDPDIASVVEQLTKKFDTRRYRMSLKEAPLIRLMAAQLPDGTWYALQLLHHLLCDHNSFEYLEEEVETVASGQKELIVAKPYRNLVALVRKNFNSAASTNFFNEMLQDIENPTLPFGLCNVRCEAEMVDEMASLLPKALNDRLRNEARRLMVSLASMCHFAWALVLSRSSGRQNTVVFGTVLFGLSQGIKGIDSSMGPYFNTLPFRVDTKEIGIEKALRQTHVRLSALMTYEHTPLASAQRSSKVPTSLPLFSTLFNYRHEREAKDRSASIPGVSILGTHERTNYPMSLSVDDFGKSLRLTAQVTPPLSAKRICSYMEQALESVADALELSNQKSAEELTVLPAEERNMMLKTWNQNTITFQKGCCLHHLFEEQVAFNGDAVALSYASETMSYIELNQRSNQLAYYLIEKGVRPESKVALCTTRSPAMIIGLLAILKAGGVYIPLDPAYSSKRLTRILKDAAPMMLLADDSGCSALEDNILPILRLDKQLPPKYNNKKGNPDADKIGLTSANLAYIIYTSGSTGIPKGVMVEHKSVVNFAFAHIQYFTLNSDSRVLQFASCGFDASIAEIVMALTSGGTLCLISNEVQHSDTALLNYFTTDHITHAILPPAIFQPDQDLSELAGLQALILAGEAPPVSLLQRASCITNVFNCYGPTEGTVCTTVWACPKGFASFQVPIGRPIANIHVYILDSKLEPVPLGAEGEIYIGGINVARGYLNRPELTAERFIPDPFSTISGAHMYRTGDLARYMPDGNILYLGRTDNQVKIRGFRIELGEIEAQLNSHSLVRQALVMPWRSEHDVRLVAYVISEAFEGLPETLRIYLKDQLPEYMVPAAFISLQDFPLTINGKIDKNALPPPTEQSFARQVYEIPQGMLEQQLATIWSDILRIEHISRHDDFFALGGHSLLAIKLRYRIQSDFGRLVSLSTIFSKPTLKDLSEEIQSAPCEKLPVIKMTPRDDTLELSFSQQRLWFLCQLESCNAAYNVPIALGMQGSLNSTILRQCLQLIFSRHEALRTIFLSVNGVPKAQLLPGSLEIPFTEHDLKGDVDAESKAKELCEREAHMPFDISKGPLIRAFLIWLDNDSSILLITVHHIIFDGASVNVLWHELSALYTDLSSEKIPSLPGLNVQYPDYAAWQRTWSAYNSLSSQLEYWFHQLNGAPSLLNLPTDHPRPSEQCFKGASIMIVIDKELTEKVFQFNRENGTTLFTTILTAWSIVLSKLSNQEDIVVGTPVENRVLEEIEPLIGFFVNTLALRVNLKDGSDGELTVDNLLNRVKKCVIDAQANQDLPFEQVVERLNPPRLLGCTPITQVFLTCQEGELSLPILRGIEVSTKEIDFKFNQFDLELSLHKNDGQLYGYWRYATALFNSDTIQRHSQYLINTLRTIVSNKSQIVSSLKISSPNERDLIVRGWNQTHVKYPFFHCMQQLFEEQVMRDGAAVALSFENEELSYAELNARANQLAHCLIDKGVRPETRVCVSVSRGPMLIIGFLGILKAGGVYVPLDPTYSSERLKYMLEDTAPFLVLVDEHGREALGTHNTQALDLDKHLKESLSTENPEAFKLGLMPTNLAYIIYTSGSTGKPKGVMVEHQSAINLAFTMMQVFKITRDSHVLQFASCGFDASIAEMIMALTSGGRLCLIPNELRHCDTAILNYLNTAKITHALLPPAIFQPNQNLSELAGLTTLILGGESPAASLIKNCSRETSVFNAYGPTEGTVISTTWSSPNDFASSQVPIGRPIANIYVYVLDSKLEPVPLGATGEIYIGGAGVARGYLNRPDLTAERFLPDPFSTRSGARMYRTGDLARYLPDGNIVYLGRNDNQVKIRGFRIELGEVEAHLNSHPRICESLVLPWGSGPKSRLVAYVVSEEIEALANNLRLYLLTRVPEYMIPAAFVRMPSFPLNTNGKVDRNALPVPDEQAFALEVFEAPLPGMEKKIAALWSDLLEVNNISRQDNFFALGGNSLLAVQFSTVAKLNEIPVDTRDIFSFPTVKDLALCVTGSYSRNVRDVAIPARSSGDRAPIFVVPDGNGDHSYAFALAHVIDKDFPVYALRWQSPEESQPQTLIEIATRMISILKQLQPYGPCSIIGFSNGGLLAYEMANQLLSTGYPVNFLGLLDTYAPCQFTLNYTEYIIQIAIENVGFNKRHDDSYLNRLSQMSLQEAIKEIKRHCSASENTDYELDISLLKQRYNYQLTCGEYKVHSIPLAVHLFRANEKNPLSCSFVKNKKYIQILNDYSKKDKLGWETCCSTDNFNLVTVDGNHRTMLKNPSYRTSLGKLISRSLMEC